MVVGKNILDNLTTGMYKDSKVIYREYIQNACDQIDIAIKDGPTQEEQGLVDIFIDAKRRYVSIKDNATGVKESEFQENLGNIADSNKKIGQNKGFRGIGRLCGLAYCKTLKFRTSYTGEKVASTMICDAEKMREILRNDKKYTLDEVWNAIVTFETKEAPEEEHFFEVELLDVNNENTDLLDKEKVENYLSFVAPVPYTNKFLRREDIYKYAERLKYKIDEYCIKINGNQIFKEYTTNIKEKNNESLRNYDKIDKLEFKDFRSDDNSLMAWMWIGISRFEKQIPSVNQMRGLRLRCGNIQIGGDNALEAHFKEGRGNYYFVGEVFAVSKELIPNSQRDYFNENETRTIFEKNLKTYFYEVLHCLYTKANRIKNAYKRQEEYLSKENEFQQKNNENGFINEEDRKKQYEALEKAKKDADDAKKNLERLGNEAENTPLAWVKKAYTEKFESKRNEVVDAEFVEDNKEKKKLYVAQTMSNLSRSERKIVTKIMSIITDLAPKDVAEKIIDKIKEELR